MKSFLCFFLSMVVLTGCVEQKDANRPSEEASLKAAQVRAHRNDIANVATATNFKRLNGYADSHANNLYKVDYSFEMALEADFPQAILALAKTTVVVRDPSDESLQSAIDITNETMTVTNWVTAQENFDARRDKLLARCPECKQWMFGEPNVRVKDARATAFVLAWQKLEQMGFKDDLGKGGTAPWTVTVPMMKTEQGWMDSNL